MLFHRVLGIQKVTETDQVNNREAVRAVIIKDDKILMVRLKQGDYKFPGGGVEQNENHSDALIREVGEETGYLNIKTGEKLGVVYERQNDEYEQGSIFQMTSHYYLCCLTGEKGSQKLDDYERELGFTPEWVEISEAILQNEKAAAQIMQNSWLQRETFVLRELAKMKRTTALRCF